MQDKRYIICGNAPVDGIDVVESRSLRLRLWGKDGPDKITLRIEDIDEKMCKSVPDAFQDLLEIAAYVYTADQAILRGTDEVDSFGNNWRRDLHFVIPVRKPDFWNSFEVLDVLHATLGFLSDDQYQFDFVALKDGPPFQCYLDFTDDGRLFGYPEQVVMFSGGLDSLAGAIEEIINQKRKVVLVTHKSTPKINNKHRALEALIADKAGENAPLHIGVRINKKKNLNNEYTQRSRSFLYVSIGATITRMLNLKSVRFYENGVISLNLPVCAQVVGGRATRTTHPRVIKGFQDIISLVAGEPFSIENPFIWKTKTDVVEMVTRAGCHEMIPASMSCSHTWVTNNRHTHCGTCSQCIDRRFAVIAAKAEDFDPVDAYKSDIFTQSREKDADKIMAAAYLERANQVRDFSDITQFIARYSEVCRVFRFLDGNPASVAQRVFDLYKRHAKEVCAALDTMIAKNITAIRERTLPSECLLRTVYESGSVVCVPAVTTKQEQPANYFRKRGGVWTARFQGNQEILLIGVDKGSEYINILLGRPNQKISVFEIVCGFAIDACNTLLCSDNTIDDTDDGFQITTGVPLTDAGFVADRKAVEQYREAAQDLLKEIDEARSANDAAKIQELEREMVQITGAIKEATGLGNRLRKAKDKRKNIRDAFRTAVNRAIDYIEQYDGPLYNHLKTAIKCGNEVAYMTQEDLVWDLRPIVNE
jgi:7-cyano-7-deazaguanine synthase in queuosine biosynthesis